MKPSLEPSLESSPGPERVVAVVSSGRVNTRLRLSSGHVMTFPTVGCPRVGDVLPFSPSDHGLGPAIRPLLPSDSLSVMLSSLDDFVSV